MTPLDARIAPLTDVPRVESLWRALETRADRAFFLSWPWIGTWLETLEAPPWVLEVSAPDGRVIGLGLFCESRETRKKLIRARQLCLHQTGDSSRDIITIEYNSLLVEQGMEEAVWAAALKALRDPDAPRWDEVIVGGATGELGALFERLGLTPHCRAETTSAYVDLAALRREGVRDAEGYIATLGKSTRSQVRRSIKLYRERGELALDVAGSLEEAQGFLAELGEWHEAKWAAQGESGATSNADYMTFHTRLMERAYAGDGEVEFLRARAGERGFGWLYNFVDRGRVLFYLSGFAFEDDNRLKPGLVTHALAIERHLERGMDVYDFMGGTNRYKTSLGQPGPDIAAYALQRRTPMMLLEGVARNVRDRLKR